MTHDYSQPVNSALQLVVLEILLNFTKLQNQQHVSIFLSPGKLSVVAFRIRKLFGVYCSRICLDEYLNRRSSYWCSS